MRVIEVSAVLFGLLVLVFAGAIQGPVLELQASEPAGLEEIDVLILEKYTEYVVDRHDVECVAMLAKSREFGQVIAGNANGISLNLVMAIIATESSFGPEKINYKNNVRDSFGLMQINRGNFNAYSFGDPDDTTNVAWQAPAKNIDAGTKIFNFMFNRDKFINCQHKALKFENAGSTVNWHTALALSAYNTGQDNVECEAVPDYTYEHVAKALAWHRIFEENYGKSKTDSGFCRPLGVAVESVEYDSLLDALAGIDKKLVEGLGQ